jgi:hypothetical protein
MIEENGHGGLGLPGFPHLLSHRNTPSNNTAESRVIPGGTSTLWSGPAVGKLSEVAGLLLRLVCVPEDTLPAE